MKPTKHRENRMKLKESLSKRRNLARKKSGHPSLRKLKREIRSASVLSKSYLTRIGQSTCVTKQGKT